MKRNSKQTIKKTKKPQIKPQGKKTIKLQKAFSPHDRFFKEVYSNPKLAIELLKLTLPKEEWSYYDWDGIKFEKDTLKKGLTADLVFSLPLKKDRKKRLRIVIICEHKSQYEKDMFNKLLYYQTYLHEQFIKMTGRPQPTVILLFYNGRKSWKWKLSFKEALFSDSISKISLSWRKVMLNYGVKLVDVHDKSLKKFLKDKSFKKSQGILNLFAKIWTLKDKKRIKEEDLLKILSEFGVFSTKADNDLVLSIMNYFKSAGVSDELLERTEQEAFRKRIFTKKGVYMDVRENIREEGRWEGIKKGRQERNKEVILNLLKKKQNISFISEVTGVSEKEIKKLKNGA